MRNKRLKKFLYLHKRKFFISLILFLILYKLISFLSLEHYDIGLVRKRSDLVVYYWLKDKGQERKLVSRIINNEFGRCVITDNSNLIKAADIVIMDWKVCTLI